jgi:hypothetical protein
MRYLCLGYFDERKWNEMSDKERENFIGECFAYDKELRDSGHFVGGEALQAGGTTISHDGGKVVVTDGPFAETREQIGGVLVLEARDLNHAIQIMSSHPGIRVGPFVIRPTDPEMDERYQEWLRDHSGA